MVNFTLQSCNDPSEQHQFRKTMTMPMVVEFESYKKNLLLLFYEGISTLKNLVPRLFLMHAINKELIKAPHIICDSLSSPRIEKGRRTRKVWIQCHTRTFGAFCCKESRRIEKNTSRCGGRRGCNEIYSIR